MTIKFKAFAAVKDEKDGWKRIAESMHETETEAEKAAADFEKIHKGSITGTHKILLSAAKSGQMSSTRALALRMAKPKHG